MPATFKDLYCPICGRQPQFSDFQWNFQLYCPDHPNSIHVETDNYSELVELWKKKMAPYNLGNCPLCDSSLRYTKVYPDSPDFYIYCNNDECLLHWEKNSYLKGLIKNWREKVEKYQL